MIMNRKCHSNFWIARLRYKHRGKSQRGTAAVEFALLLLPMLLLSFGVVEYGRAIYHYNTLVKSVRSAVRLMSAYSPDDTAYGTHATEARCIAVHGTPDCSGEPLAPNLTVAQIKICDRKSWSGCTGSSQATYRNVPTGSGAINLVEVRISGYALPFIGLPLVITSPTITLGPIESVMRQAG